MLRAPQRDSRMPSEPIGSGAWKPLPLGGSCAAVTSTPRPCGRGGIVVCPGVQALKGGAVSPKGRLSNSPITRTGAKHMRVRSAVSGLAVLLVSCGPSPAELAKQRAADAAAKAAAEAKHLVGRAEADIMISMRDPESTRFRSLRIVRTRGDKGSTATAVCGEVNAKNGFGGYAGYQPFWYVAEFHPQAGEKDSSPPMRVGLFKVVGPVPASNDSELFRDPLDAAADFDDLCNHDGQTIRDSDLRVTGNLAAIDEYLQRTAKFVGFDLSPATRRTR